MDGLLISQRLAAVDLSVRGTVRLDSILESGAGYSGNGAQLRACRLERMADGKCWVGHAD